MPEASVIPKPVQRPHPPIYQVCVSKDGIENTALRGWPMLNSVLFGPVDQLVANRTVYVDTLEKARRSPAEIAALLGRWGVSRQIYVAETDAEALAEAKDAELWYQESFRRFVLPERIEDEHPALQPGFRAMAERLSAVRWETLVRETLAFGSPDTVARHIEAMRQTRPPLPHPCDGRFPHPASPNALDETSIHIARPTATARPELEKTADPAIRLRPSTCNDHPTTTHRSPSATRSSIRALQLAEQQGPCRPGWAAERRHSCNREPPKETRAEPCGSHSPRMSREPMARPRAIATGSIPERFASRPRQHAAAHIRNNAGRRDG